MADHKMTVESFTVSSNFDTHRGGEKSSHFVSFGVRLDPPVPVDELPALQLQAAYKVSVAAIHDALMRGALTVEDANSRIRDLQDNYSAIRTSFEKKAAKTETK